ncbi:MAG: HDIG domain-containing metalloprotein [Acidimicrobiales bacterium]
MAGPVHLARRFAGSLRPGGPPAADVDWVGGVLSEPEMALWWRMSGPDRRHSVAVARRVERSLGHEATAAVLAAALLHDVGKTQSGLGTYGRVVATLSAAVAGHEMATVWSRKTGFVRKVGLYLRHDEIGADQLYMAGSDPVTVAWAREHHRPPQDWTVPPHLGHALKDADDD